MCEKGILRPIPRTAVNSKQAPPQKMSGALALIIAPKCLTHYKPCRNDVFSYFGSFSSHFLLFTYIELHLFFLEVFLIFVIFDFLKSHPNNFLIVILLILPKFHELVIGKGFFQIPRKILSEYFLLLI